MQRIADRVELRVYGQNLLLGSNLNTATLSNVNLTVCIHGRWKRAEQLSLRFYIHEPDIRGLNLVVGSGVVWKRCDDPPNGGGGCYSDGTGEQAGSEETM